MGINLPQRRKVNVSETFNKGVFTKSKISTCNFCKNEFFKYPSHGGKFCSYECQHKKQYSDYIVKWKNGDIDGLCINGYTISQNIRKYLFEKNNHKCESCKWGEINKHTGLIPLQIHHIDGDCKNNKENNLQLLCPNCHCLTENFGSRNKNSSNGRSEYFGRSKKKII